MISCVSVVKVVESFKITRHDQISGLVTESRVRRVTFVVVDLSSTTTCLERGLVALVLESVPSPYSPTFSTGPLR